MNERIKELRKRLNLTQQEFADRLSIKRGAVANYEVGRNTPSDSVIALICREFNVSERWLREGDGEMFLPQDDAAELMMLAGRFLGSEPTEFQQRFARMILSLPPEGWELLERKARELLGETKKED
nr:MAG TPA: helix-turn-helix domain protein [Caudoviricetes sp.]